MKYTGRPVYEIRPVGHMKAQLEASLRYAYPGPLHMNYRLRRYESEAAPRMDFAFMLP